jgi:hypothetical protein
VRLSLRYYLFATAQGFLPSCCPLLLIRGENVVSIWTAKSPKKPLMRLGAGSLPIIWIAAWQTLAKIARAALGDGSG